MFLGIIHKPAIPPWHIKDVFGQLVTKISNRYLGTPNTLAYLLFLFTFLLSFGLMKTFSFEHICSRRWKSLHFVEQENYLTEILDIHPQFQPLVNGHWTVIREFSAMRQEIPREGKGEEI